MKFKFRVKLNYNYFIFENSSEALAFALSACNHQVDYPDDNYEVSIDFIRIEEKTEDPEDGRPD